MLDQLEQVLERIKKWKGKKKEKTPVSTGVCGRQEGGGK